MRKEEQPAAQSEEAQAVMEDVLENADGVQDVQFAKTAKKNKMISVEVSGCPVSWGFTGANNSRIEVTQKEEDLTGNLTAFCLYRRSRRRYTTETYLQIRTCSISSPLSALRRISS